MIGCEGKKLSERFSKAKISSAMSEMREWIKKTT